MASTIKKLKLDLRRAKNAYKKSIAAYKKLTRKCNAAKKLMNHAFAKLFAATLREKLRRQRKRKKAEPEDWREAEEVRRGGSFVGLEH
jgi:hypothetical protein